jgi:hypothetical protein
MYFVLTSPHVSFPAMPTLEDIVGWFFLILFFGVIGLAAWCYANPTNPVSRGLERFWNTPAIKQFRMFIWRAFWVCFLGYLVIVFVSWYFEESGWYPREREVQVYFKAHQWIDGEIQTCYSNMFTTDKGPDAELKQIACTFNGDESHVLKVTFWGPIKADKNRTWKCQRSSTSMICKLQ